MTTRRVFHAVALVVVIATTAFVPVCLAETKVMTAEASYTMGDGESPTFAEAQVLQKAKQAALEQAGTYVEAYTKTHNYDLTTEEIQTLTGGVLKVEVLEKTRTLVGEGLRFYTKIKATVTTDKMEELARRIKGRNVAEEYKKLQDEYARLSRELETWKQLAAKTPQGPEHDAALDQIREREKAFANVQKSEAALFRHLVSGEVLVAEGQDEKALVDKLIESIKRDGHVISISKVRAFPSKDTQDRATLSVPITLRRSPVLFTLLSDAARKLGGNGLKDLGTYYAVRLSRSRPIEEYFTSRVTGLFLVVALNYDNPGIPNSCWVSRVVNRLILNNHGSVLLLTEVVSFTVEFDLAVNWAKRVQQITATWMDWKGGSSDPSPTSVRECRITTTSAE